MWFWIQKEWTKQDNLDAVSTRCVPSPTNLILSSQWFPFRTILHFPNTQFHCFSIPKVTLQSILLFFLISIPHLISCVSPQFLALFHYPLRFHAFSVLHMTLFSIVLAVGAFCFCLAWNNLKCCIASVLVITLFREILWFLGASWIVVIGSIRLWFWPIK